MDSISAIVGIRCLGQPMLLLDDVLYVVFMKQTSLVNSKNVKLIGLLIISYNQLPGLLKDWNLYDKFCIIEDEDIFL